MSQEVLSEIREIKDRLSVVEYLLRANLIPEAKPIEEEKRAIREFETDTRTGKAKTSPLEGVIKTTRKDPPLALSSRTGKESH